MCPNQSNALQNSPTQYFSPRENTPPEVWSSFLAKKWTPSKKQINVSIKTAFNALHFIAMAKWPVWHHHVRHLFMLWFFSSEKSDYTCDCFHIIEFHLGHIMLLNLWIFSIHNTHSKWRTGDTVVLAILPSIIHVFGTRWHHRTHNDNVLTCVM